jgi:hypothetical protein
VSNRHILLQFEGKSVPKKNEEGCVVEEKSGENGSERNPLTIIFEANGMMVTQEENVQTALNSAIIGESSIKLGKKTIITQSNSDDNESKDLVLIQFDYSGKGKVIKVIHDYITNFIELITDKNTYKPPPLSASH